MSSAAAIIPEHEASRRQLYGITQTPNRCLHLSRSLAENIDCASTTAMRALHPLFVPVAAHRQLQCARKPFATVHSCMRSCRRTCSLGISHSPPTSCAERLTLHCRYGVSPALHDRPYGLPFLDIHRLRCGHDGGGCHLQH